MDDGDAPQCGYRVANLDQFDRRFRCLFCRLIMNDPIQLTECGHRSCRACFDYQAAQSSESNVTCPEMDCQEVTPKDKIMSDKAFKRELDVLPVACAYQPCSWTGPLKDYQIHLDGSHAVHRCVDCGENLSSSLALHEHRTQKCPAVFQRCPLAPVCSEELVRKDQISSHYLSGSHQEGVVQIITGRSRLPPPSPEPEDLQVLAMQSDFEAKIHERLSDLANQAEAVNDQTVRIDETFTQFDERRQRVAEGKQRCQLKLAEQLPVMSQIQQTQLKLQKDVEAMHEIFDSNQHISTNGSLTWRIDRMSEKFADAQSERKLSIYSPVFYSSPTGYKMRARLFPFGDGNARRTHMSLFFLLLKGDHDAILTWPFKYKISFCLLDQTENGAHVIDSFHPDVKSNSFHRPTTETNVANGLPKFVNLTMVQQDNNPYVREDTMYIKIVVHLTERPNLYLPLLLKVNPALPAHVQEHLVQQELSRQQQEGATAAAASVN